MGKDYQQVYAYLDDLESEAYTRGFNNGLHLAIEKYDEGHMAGYDTGLRDAWSLARKVIRMDSSQQFEIFGEHGDINVLDYKSAEEALKMYNAWKEKQTPKETTKAKVEALIDEGHKIADIMYAVKQIADGDPQWFDIA